MKKSYFNLLGPKYFLLLVFISSCSGGGSSEIKTPEISDLNINVDSDSTQRIQEMHILIGHIICDLVERHYIS